MPDMDDMQLLREYARGRSEQAFTTLVSRHLGLVHSVALRQVANSSQAEEITQAVFIILARKAEKLRPGTILAGWLFNTTRLTAANFIRDQSRRRRHEQEAAMQSQIQESGTDVWRRLAPLLDEAVADLNEADRNAILLRFMQGHDFKAISAATGASEDSVRMRVNRALEKLRKFFAHRGVSQSVALITATLSANMVQAAPAGLLASVSTAALAKAAPVAASTAAVVKATLHAMALAKLKTALIVGVGAVVVAGTVTIAVIQTRSAPADVAQTPFVETAPEITAASQPPKPSPVPPPQIPAKQNIPPAPAQTAALPAATNPSPAPAGISVTWPVNPQALAQQPPRVMIRPSELARPGGRGTGMSSSTSGTLATGSTLNEIVAYAYNVPPAMRNRILMPADAPDGYFDFMDTLPQGGREALQQVLKEQYGLVARREIRAVETLSVTIANTGAPGLRANTSGDVGGGGSIGNGKVRGKNATMAGITSTLESMVGTPVIDQTGATDCFDYELSFKPGASVEEIKQAALDQLGLALVPSPEKLPVEFLTVEKADKTSINNKEQ